MSELLNLYRSNTAITARDERELALFLPEPGKLVSPLEFEQLIIEQAQLLQKNLSYRRDLWSQGVGDNSPEAIQDLQNRLINAIEPLRNISGWRLAAIAAGREGGHSRHAWDDLLVSKYS